jgi:hypothetical protein
MVDKDSLLQWRFAMTKEIMEIERKLETLKEQLRMKREQLRAVEVLIGPSEADSQSSISPDAKPGTMTAVDLLPKKHGAFTPIEAYWVPILESLVECGGQERSDVILERVSNKMANILTPDDHKLLPSGLSPRWRNRAQWQRQNMVQQGLISKDSPRGVWQITPAGREWLAKAQEEERKTAAETERLIEKYGYRKRAANDV